MPSATQILSILLLAGSHVSAQADFPITASHLQRITAVRELESLQCESVCPGITAAFTSFTAAVTKTGSCKEELVLTSKMTMACFGAITDNLCVMRAALSCASKQSAATCPSFYSTSTDAQLTKDLVAMSSCFCTACPGAPKVFGTMLKAPAQCQTMVEDATENKNMCPACGPIICPKITDLQCMATHPACAATTGDGKVRSLQIKDWCSVCGYSQASAAAAAPPAAAPPAPPTESSGSTPGQMWLAAGITTLVCCCAAVAAAVAAMFLCKPKKKRPVKAPVKEAEPLVALPTTVIAHPPMPTGEVIPVGNYVYPVQTVAAPAVQTYQVAAAPITTATASYAPLTATSLLSPRL